MCIFFICLLLFTQCLCQEVCQQCEVASKCEFCENNSNVFQPNAEIKSNIFNILTIQEYQQVVDYVVEQLNLEITKFSEDGSIEFPPPGPSQDQLIEVDIYPVPKKEAIEYLDFNGVRPQKYALATVVRGSRSPPDVVEYKVGPLPVNASTQIEQIIGDGEIPWKKHPYFVNQLIYAQDIIAKTTYYLREIFKYQTGGFCSPYFPQLLYLGDEPGEECGFIDRFTWLEYPAISEEGRRVGRIFYHFQPDIELFGDGYNLFSIPITFSLDTTEPNASAWFVYDFVYCHQGPFNTKEELLEKFNSGELHRCQGATEWGTLKTPEEEPLLDDSQNNTQTNPYDFRWAEIFEDSIYSLYGPEPQNGQLQTRSFMPQGHRFQILGENDPTGRRFKWLDWEAHFTINNRLGPSFFDINFKGERIIYELSLQEQYVAYSGFGGMGQLQYFDSYFGLGTSTTPLQRGLDCPEFAVYLSSVKSSQFLMGYIQSDDICIFEDDLQVPLWRHYVPSMGRVYGSRDSQLVVRMVLTLENYDYLYSIAFRRDGSLHVEVNMNGYVTTSFFDPQGKTWRDGGMGTRLHNYAFANLHDHLSSWKVDIDVKGQSNSFMTYKEKSTTYEDAVQDYKNFLSDTPLQAYLSQKMAAFNYELFTPQNECENSLEEPVKIAQNFPGWFENQEVKFMQMQVEEKELGLKMSYDTPSIFQFINEHKINEWGNPKGYNIKLGSTTGQVLSDGHPYLQAAAWTKYHLAVTKRKDNEPSVMSAKYDWFLPQTPIVSLNNFLDGENIKNEDLVAWVNVGVQHLPHSEDVPLISAISTGFQIVPRNYFGNMQGINGFEKPGFEFECVPNFGQADEAQQ